MGSLVLFVCTGNTCRSPMAEALLKLALPASSPWRVASAGLAACTGSGASDAAVTAIGEVGGDLRGHRSQPVSEQLVQSSDVIVAMTAAHAQQLIALYPSSRDRLFLMRSFDPGSPDPSDVADPFRGTVDEYRRCRDMLRRAIPGLLDFLSRTEQPPLRNQ